MKTENWWLACGNVNITRALLHSSREQFVDKYGTSHKIPVFLIGVKITLVPIDYFVSRKELKKLVKKTNVF